MKKTKILLASTALLFTMTSLLKADNTSELLRENAKLKERVDKLEKELEELKKIVMKQSAKEKQQKKPPVSETKAKATPQLSDADLKKIMAMVRKETIKKKPVWSNLDIQLYGYIKADASYDTSRTTSGNYVVWADSEATNDNDNEFNLTANQTRLGLKITGPEDEGAITSGRVEIDFYGNYAAENKAKIQLRHAYLKIDWPEDKFHIIAGQTSDVFSPLVPETLNYTVLWDAGNIGYRRPQIRLTKSIALRDDTDLKLEAAVARTIGRSNSTLGLATVSESGEDAGFPSLQGRTSLTFPSIGYKPTTVGVSGHWAKEEYDVTNTGKNKKFDSWSVNLDLTQPINKWLTIKGEYFKGENLNTYFGGIGQGVNNTTYEEIASTGGWVAAGLGPWHKWRFNVGAGMDDVEDSDINTGDRSMNRSVFGNVIYSVNKNTEIGLELSHWRTEYKGSGDADSLRAQTAFTYKF